MSGVPDKLLKKFLTSTRDPCFKKEYHLMNKSMVGGAVFLDQNLLVLFKFHDDLDD